MHNSNLVVIFCINNTLFDNVYIVDDAIFSCLFYFDSTYSQFFPITSRTGALLVVGKDIDQQEFFSGFFKSVSSGMLRLNIHQVYSIGHWTINLR